MQNWTEIKIEPFEYTTSIAPIDFYKNDEERTSVTNDDFVDVKPLPQYDSKRKEHWARYIKM
jgi:hypothetical protein